MKMNQKFALIGASMLAAAAVSSPAFAFEDEAGCTAEVHEAEQALVKANVSTEKFAAIGAELEQIRGLCGTDLAGAKTALAATLKDISASAGN